MKIAVLVSGGVDSAVALRLLHQEKKHDLTAFYLKIWLEDELSFLGNCPWQEDLALVQTICDEINVPLRIISLQKEYHDAVVAYTIAEARVGRTPNPDVLCNSLIKFGCFLEHIADEHFDKVASGHYGFIVASEGVFRLQCAVDVIKDQTYFLAGLTQKQLSSMILPLGNLLKSEVRLLAEQFQLPNKDRKDSQGICFLGKIKFKDFIKAHLGVRPGKFIEYETGRYCGEHEGCWFYTIGQRQGIGLSHGPWYVVAKNIEKNEIFISSDYSKINNLRTGFQIKKMHWFDGFVPINSMSLEVKIRHGAARHKAVVTWNSESECYEVALNIVDQGIAAGQFAVFYDNNFCVGSGFIDTDSLKGCR